MAADVAAPAPAPTEPPSGPLPWKAWFAPAGLGAGLMLTLLAGFLVAAIAAAFGADFGGDDTPPGVTIVTTILQGLCFVVAAIAFAALVGRARPAEFGLVRTKLAPAFGWTVLALVAFLAFTAAWTTAIGSNAEEDAPRELGADEHALALIGVLVLVTVVAPICEEFFFRGFFFTTMRPRLGLWGAALVTGLVFGLAHALGSAVEFLLPLAFLGLVFCLLYAKTGSLFPGVGLHAFNNGLATGVSLDWEGWQVALAAFGAPVVAICVLWGATLVWRRHET